MKKKIYIIAVLLSVCLAACSKKTNVLPDFTGSSEEEITAWAEENEINADFIYQESLDYEEGTCISTFPESLSEINKGDTVNFIITIRPNIDYSPGQIPVPTDPTLKPSDYQTPDTENLDTDLIQDSISAEESDMK